MGMFDKILGFERNPGSFVEFTTLLREGAIERGFSLQIRPIKTRPEGKIWWIGLTKERFNFFTNLGSSGAAHGSFWWRGPTKFEFEKIKPFFLVAILAGMMLVLQTYIVSSKTSELCFSSVSVSTFFLKFLQDARQ